MLLKNVKGTDHEKTIALNEAISALGSCLIHMHEIAAEVLSCASVQEFLSLVKTYEELKLGDCKGALDEFAVAYPRIKDHQLLQQIAKQELALSDLCKILKTTNALIIKRNAEIEPHVLYVDPKTKTVSFGFHFMKRLVADHQPKKYYIF